MSVHLSKLVLNVLDPFHLIRGLILFPATLLGIYDPRQHERRDQNDDEQPSSTREENVDNLTAKDIALKTTFLAFTGAIIVWTSIFMYVTFYYTYMPAIEHVRPVHIQFDACNHNSLVPTECEFPHAFVPLTRRQNLLMLGQSYKIYLHIEMPETQRNRDLGMFMVCADLRDDSTELLDHSCRSVMLHYKSSIVRAIRTWLLSPLYVFQIQEETQRLEVELYSDYGEDQSRPVRDVFVEIQSRHIQFYSVTLHIVAHFTGLRYIMFHWPFVSATVGICTNIFFILIVTVLSWYHWGDSMWLERRMEQRLRRRRRKRSRPVSDTSGNRSVEAMLKDDSRNIRTNNEGSSENRAASTSDEYVSDQTDIQPLPDDDEIINLTASGQQTDLSASECVDHPQSDDDAEITTNAEHVNPPSYALNKLRQRFARITSRTSNEAH